MCSQTQQVTQVSIHKHDGATYSWQFAGENDKVFYVTKIPTSSADDVNHGASIDYAFASVRYACDYINADVANRTPLQFL